MDFRLPAEDDPRRAAVRTWFAEHPKPTWRQLAEAGYTVPHWPAPWGMAADPEQQIIIDQEMSRAGVTSPNLINPVAINNCALTLLTHGTDAQRDRFLIPALACEEIWCMLFSEPAGGSDLAALRTAARRDGEDWIVSGQKTWTSLAHKAAIGVLIARTDPHAPKHAGMSAFLIDMASPGVTVRPVIDLSGHENEYNEVFLDEVRIPADRLLGVEGAGWKIATSQLQTERVALSKPGAIWGGGPSARELVAGLAETGDLADPVVRDKAAEIFIEGELLRLLAYRALSDRMHARPSGPEGAIRKMLAAPHGQRIVELAKAVQGARGMIAGEQPFPSQVGAGKGMFADWDYAFWFSPAVTLGVGTQEILKNIVAERTLGLPRESDPTTKLPWDEAGRGSAMKPAAG
jgi:alkylation response protein AidB-like acyl-CoA dehydrogenase